MDVEKYIASGILEQYVAGTLSEPENLEVQRYADEYPEIQNEIAAIEQAILGITKAASPGLSPHNFSSIKGRLNPVIPLDTSIGKKRTSRTNYLGWAACLLFATGLLWMYVNNNKLRSEIEVVTKEKSALEEQIISFRDEITNTEALLNQLRDQNVAVVSLGGQTVAPGAYAKAYWNKEEDKVFIDAQGLPEPPDGYDYQVWSLQLNPLTPTSIGVLANFTQNDKQVFELSNPNESEAFGITLEPEGGSEAPTLEQLYTLGTVGP